MRSCLAGLVALVAVVLAAPATASAVPFEIISFDGGVFDQAALTEQRAGSHPWTASTEFEFNRTTVPGQFFPNKPYGTLKDVTLDLPAGLVGNPQAVPKCTVPTDSQLGKWVREGNVVCPPETQIGIVELRGATGTVYYALFNIEPAPGTAAQFLFVVNNVPVRVTGKVLPGDFRIRTLAINSPQTVVILGVTATIWGVPASPAYDTIRGSEPTGQSCLMGEIAGGASCPKSSSAPSLPFLTVPTSCVGPVDTDLVVTTWEGEQDSAFFTSHDTELPPNPVGNTDCDQVPFTPSVSVSPSSSTADSATGLDASISVPSDGLLDPEGISQSHLRDTVVELPEGVSVNPSGATGLASCSDAQLSLETDDVPSCPEASRIATVEVKSPLLEETLEGYMVLRTPNSTDPESGEMFRLALVVDSPERGIVIKVPGSATADAQTGKLVATFDENPQLPFSDLEVKVKGGQRGMLAMPQDCGQVETVSMLSPWSGNPPTIASTPSSVDGCSLGFAPKVLAGMDNPAGRGTGSFSFRFSRDDGEQWIDGLIARLPEGLLASLRGVPLCSDAEAAAAACPEGSRIGSVDASAGSGDPFVLEQKGSAYLTRGYKGCAYGMLVKVPVVAGPFDKSSPATDLGDIAVRQAVCVDRQTARVSVVSDPLPTIWHGVPLRTRSVTVTVDRPGFMLNPSDCSTKQTTATFDSTRDATAETNTPFSSTGCAGLSFEPKLALTLTGRRQVTTGKHPGIRAQVNQAGVTEAGIEKAVVTLPKSLALDPENAQALCEFTDGTKPDLENHCPAGSIVGRARATTPLLNQPLSGNVYFVKNVRRDPTTGNEIRTLPMLIVALRGEIAINLKGESSTTPGGKLVNTFASVPDAPISQFNLNIKGGENGILAVTRTRRAKINLCAGRHIAESDIDGQNGRRHDTDVRMKTPCTKKQAARAKRAAARARAAAAKRRRG